MAYIGLRKPIVGKRKEYGSYEAPFAFGKAIGINVTPNYAEGSLYADDVQSEYDKEFTFAEVTMNTDTIPVVAYEHVFGHKIEEEEIAFGADDENDYVGMGWISVEKINGKRKFTGNFLSKVKFSEPNEEYTTKGENIEYKTPSITGRALAEEEDMRWKYVKPFDTAEEALAYVYGKFGASVAALTVKSEAGTATGKTKITVTPAKEGTNSYVYKIGSEVKAPGYDETCTGGYTAWDGTAEITATSGQKILIVEITEEKKARKAGIATIVAKTA
mgnify:CR=1 FL=1